MSDNANIHREQGMKALRIAQALSDEQPTEENVRQMGAQATLALANFEAARLSESWRGYQGEH